MHSQPHSPKRWALELAAPLAQVAGTMPTAHTNESAHLGVCLFLALSFLSFSLSLSVGIMAKVGLNTMTSE